MKMKKFYEFNKQSSSDKFIRQTLTNFGFNCELDKNNKGQIKGVKDNMVFYISATDADHDYANYNVEYFLNDKIEDDFETTDLKHALEECINKKVY